MLFGKYASRKSESAYPTLWDGLKASYYLTKQSPSGLKAYDFSGNNRTMSLATPANWSRNGYTVSSGVYGTIPASAITSITGGFSVVIRGKLAATTVEAYIFARQVTADQSMTIGIKDNKFMIFRGGFLLSSLAAVNGNTYTMILNHKNGVTTLWVDGTAQITSSAAVTSGSGPFYLGRWGGGGYQQNGDFMGALIYDRGLSIGEIALLSKQFDAPLKSKRFCRVMSGNSRVMSGNKRHRLLTGIGT